MGVYLSDWTKEDTLAPTNNKHAYLSCCPRPAIKLETNHTQMFIIWAFFSLNAILFGQKSDKRQRLKSAFLTQIIEMRHSDGEALSKTWKCTVQTVDGGIGLKRLALT